MIPSVLGEPQASAQPACRSLSQAPTVLLCAWHTAACQVDTGRPDGQQGRSQGQELPEEDKEETRWHRVTPTQGTPAAAGL